VTESQATCPGTSDRVAFQAVKKTNVRKFPEKEPPRGTQPGRDFYLNLPEYSSADIALQDDLYTPSTHTSLESPRNGGINVFFTFEHGLLQEEPCMYYNVKMGLLTPKRWVYYPGHSFIIISCCVSCIMNCVCC
jgi:hypothetical protein